MAAENKRPIIIVKRKRAGGHGHHGGAWKVAYADFVTALMAFFLVMWLVSSISKEQRAALFDYFKNPSMEEGQSVKAAPGQAGPGGASTSPIDLGGGLDAPRSQPTEDNGLGDPITQIREDDARRIAEAAERRQLESLAEQLREAIDNSKSLEPFKDQLLLDITPEGLRIQIVDQQNRPMFDLGGTRLKDYTSEILRELAGYLNSVPNRISLSGHTDDKAYAGARGYSNWELSADRANAARRALLDGGLEAHKITRVVGLASSVLFDRENPYNPINRRISIIAMTKSAEARALSSDAPDVDATRRQIESGETATPQAAAPTLPAAPPAAAQGASPPAAPAAGASLASAPATPQPGAASATAPGTPATPTISRQQARQAAAAAEAAIAAARE